MGERSGGPRARRSTPRRSRRRRTRAGTRAKLHSPDTAFFIAERDGSRVGYARVDRWGPDTGEIAVSVDAPARGQGFGTRLITLAARLGAEHLGVARVVARVRGSNEASVRAFVSAGFVRQGGGDDVTLVWPGGPVVPHSRPFVGASEADAAAAVVRSRALAGGRIAAEVESDGATLTGTAAAACVASGVGALRLSLWALGVGEGDEVIMPAYSCVALLNAALVVGAKPVLADVLPAASGRSIRPMSPRA